MALMCRLFAVMEVVLVGLWVSCRTASAQATDAARPVLRVVYFVPTDRKPESDHVARLDRVLTEVQGFYREGMRQPRVKPGFHKRPAGRLMVIPRPLDHDQHVLKAALLRHQPHPHQHGVELRPLMLDGHGIDRGRRSVSSLV